MSLGGTERRIAIGLASAALAVATLLFPEPPREPEGEWGRAAEAGPCPKGMVSVRDKFCVDQFEASTVVVDKARKPTQKAAPKVLRSHSPYKPVGSTEVMAVSAKGKVPQAHITQEQAERACFNAGKRLCTDDEWLEACRGKKPTQYPYGDEHQEGLCNDKGVSGFNLLFGPGNNTPPEPHAYNMENMNDPRLNQIEGSLAKTGSFPKCKNGFKVHDMVGNLHEWTSSKQGTFRGGYYLDTKINGRGCDYRTTAHDVKYHDYSTGFRCCYGGKEQARVDAARKAEAKKASDEAKLAKAEKLAKTEKQSEKKSLKSESKARPEKAERSAKKKKSKPTKVAQQSGG